MQRVGQSSQSVPESQYDQTDPGPPSSHSPSAAYSPRPSLPSPPPHARAGVARVAVATAAVTVGVLVGVVAWCTDWGSRHSQNQGDTTRLWSRCLHRRRRHQGQRRSWLYSTRRAERRHPCRAAPHQQYLLAPADSAEPADTVRPAGRPIPRQQQTGCEIVRRKAVGRRAVVAP